MRRCVHGTLAQKLLIGLEVVSGTFRDLMGTGILTVLTEYKVILLRFVR